MRKSSPTTRCLKQGISPPYWNMRRGRPTTGAAYRLMRFLVDAQLPPALARWLVAAGHEAEHVADRGMQSASDDVIWDVALREHAVILTKDEDFAQRHALTGAGPAVVWIRLHNTRRAALLAWFGAALPEILSALARGETLIEMV
jgi:predicted nuclease of predicted toxin-antitoxin system